MAQTFLGVSLAPILEIFERLQEKRSEVQAKAQASLESARLHQRVPSVALLCIGHVIQKISGLDALPLLLFLPKCLFGLLERIIFVTNFQRIMRNRLSFSSHDCVL